MPPAFRNNLVPTACDIPAWTAASSLAIPAAIAAQNFKVLRRPFEPRQYAAEPYRLALARSGMTPSMSRKGDCLDNAPMESFFHSLKTERVHHRIYGTRAEARRDLFQYIEGFYNSRRLHSALGYVSPPFAERMAA
jgi:transposase InsO family protein